MVGDVWTKYYRKEKFYIRFFVLNFFKFYFLLIFGGLSSVQNFKEFSIEFLELYAYVNFLRRHLFCHLT